MLELIPEKGIFISLKCVSWKYLRGFNCSVVNLKIHHKEQDNYKRIYYENKILYPEKGTSP